MRRALIIGISGQDGAYLAKLLLGKGYHVIGTSRDAQLGHFHNLRYLGISSMVQLVTMSPGDFHSVVQVLRKWEPDEVYNLSGQSSVGLSFEQPIETISSIVNATVSVLDSIRFLERPIRFYNASSSECFGEATGLVDETTPFRPRSPYAAAKAAAHWIVSNYREGYGIFACNGIMFNHESPLRPARFVTQKIAQAVGKIAGGDTAPLKLGNLAVWRDWGWAEEYVEVMWRMLQQEAPDDYVVATGHLASLEEFVATAFGAVDLDWRAHVEVDPALWRPTDMRGVAGNARRASERLGWVASASMKDVALRMVAAALDARKVGATQPEFVQRNDISPSP